MKSFLVIAASLLMSSIAGAQSPPRGDTCANCNSERQNPQAPRNEQDRRAQEIVKHNEWPARPELPRSGPVNHRLFVTNFLVKNESDKEIREIKWTATLINRETQERFGTFPLATKKRIRPRKSARLKERVFVPLKNLIGSTVSASSPNDHKNPVKIDDKYEIVEIVYKDKSVVRP